MTLPGFHVQQEVAAFGGNLPVISRQRNRRGDGAQPAHQFCTVVRDVMFENCLGRFRIMPFASQRKLLVERDPGFECHDRTAACS
jgi:hypothetical protein